MKILEPGAHSRENIRKLKVDIGGYQLEFCLLNQYCAGNIDLIQDTLIWTLRHLFTYGFPGLCFSVEWLYGGCIKGLETDTPRNIQMKISK